MAVAVYNERSWAIDLIGYLKGIAHNENRAVRDVSGEQTITDISGSLFPDVLLFGDRDTARILQGWELKLPDTLTRRADASELAIGSKTQVLAVIGTKSDDDFQGYDDVTRFVFSGGGHDRAVLSPDALFMDFGKDDQLLAPSEVLSLRQMGRGEIAREGFVGVKQVVELLTAEGTSFVEGRMAMVERIVMVEMAG